MRLGNLLGRPVLVNPDKGVCDIERWSDGAISADFNDVYAQIDAIRTLIGAKPPTYAAASKAAFGPPSPAPRQVFAIGLNYREHARESGHAVPATPSVFTKFQTCLTGDDADVVLPSQTIDWEVELVAIVGRQARNVSAADGWAHIAALTIGQDLSDRAMQIQGSAPQFSLSKSYPGFGPVGPIAVTPDELASPDDLRLACILNGETVQDARTSDMVFSVPDLVAELSAVCTLLPGDLIFTGTPSGIGGTRSPPRFLAPGDLVESVIEGIGALRLRCRAPEPQPAQ